MPYSDVLLFLAADTERPTYNVAGVLKSLASFLDPLRNPNTYSEKASTGFYLYHRGEQQVTVASRAKFTDALLRASPAKFTKALLRAVDKKLEVNRNAGLEKISTFWKRHSIELKTSSGKTQLDTILLMLWKFYFEQPQHERCYTLVFNDDVLANEFLDLVKRRRKELPPLTWIQIANNADHSSDSQDKPESRLRSNSSLFISPAVRSNTQLRRKTLWARLRSLFTANSTQTPTRSWRWFRWPKWLGSRKNRVAVTSTYQPLVRDALANRRRGVELDQIEKTAIREQKRINEQRVWAEKRSLQARTVRSTNCFTVQELITKKYHIDRQLGELRHLYLSSMSAADIFDVISDYFYRTRPKLTSKVQSPQQLVSQMAILIELVKAELSGGMKKAELEKLYILYVYNIYLEHVKLYAQDPKSEVIVDRMLSDCIRELVRWGGHIAANNTMFTVDEKIVLLQKSSQELKSLYSAIVNSNKRAIRKGGKAQISAELSLAKMLQTVNMQISTLCQFALMVTTRGWRRRLGSMLSTARALTKYGYQLRRIGIPKGVDDDLSSFTAGETRPELSLRIGS